MSSFKYGSFFIIIIIRYLFAYISIIIITDCTVNEKRKAYI
jgi:hypothetical protein